MRSELIIATYNKPAYLDLCLSTAIRQVRKPDSTCIADDGSDHRTRDVIERVRTACPGVDIRHSCHEDDGFRKSAALNKAIASSNADYLIFIDDDCLLHPAFVRRHLIMTAVVPMSEVPDAGQVRSARPTARGPARLPEASQHGALPRIASVGFNKYATRALRHRADAWPRRKRAAHGVVHHKVRDSLTTQLLSSEGADA